MTSMIKLPLDVYPTFRFQISLSDRRVILEMTLKVDDLYFLKVIISPETHSDMIEVSCTFQVVTGKANSGHLGQSLSKHFGRGQSYRTERHFY